MFLNIVEAFKWDDWSSVMNDINTILFSSGIKIWLTYNGGMSFINHSVILYSTSTAFIISPYLSNQIWVFFTFDMVNHWFFNVSRLSWANALAQSHWAYFSATKRESLYSELFHISWYKSTISSKSSFFNATLSRLILPLYSKSYQYKFTEKSSPHVQESQHQTNKLQAMIQNIIHIKLHTQVFIILCDSQNIYYSKHDTTYRTNQKRPCSYTFFIYFFLKSFVPNPKCSNKVSQH